MPYIPPQNKKQYWALVDECWGDLITLIDTYLPSFGRKYIDGTPLDKTLHDYAVELKETRNPRIARVLNWVWFSLPDDKPANEIPSHTQLWDLCVMEYRLQGEEREIEDTDD